LTMKRTYHLRHTIALAVIAAMLFSVSQAAACPMCKAALGSQSAHGDWIGGFFWSILFMLSMLFATFGTLVLKMYLLVRRARREAVEREQTTLTPS
jgi:uncharacterized membrane protein